LSDLWTSYLSNDERLAPFFVHRPGDWTSAIEARARNPVEPLDGAAIEEIVSANLEWGVDPRVVARAALLASPQTRAVATGQQPGVLGGPLYTLYKMIAAVRWAERLEREQGLPTVPVFWVASEDDDFNEVRSFRWQDADGEWREYEYGAASHKPGMPLYDIAIEPHLAANLREIFGRVRQTEFTADLAQRLCDIAAEAANVESFFVRAMAWLLGDHAPIFIAAHMDWVRRRAAAIIQRELGQPGESSRRVIEAGERLAALGFSPSLHRRPEHVNCFVLHEGLRHKILTSAGRFQIIGPTGERRTVEAEPLRADARSDPARFGLNVVTRPVVQDRALPTLAYVAGPGEVGYLAQMCGVYELFGVAMPMILPRPQVCLIEPRVERALAKLGVAVESLAGAFHETSERFDDLIARATRHEAVEERLETARRRLAETLEFVASQVTLSDPAVARSFEKLRDMAETGFEKIAERQRNAALARDAETARAIATARDSLWPGGLPQERALTSFFPFLNLFGTDLIARLLEAIRIDVRGVQPIVLPSLMAKEERR
jgi:bacillithiol biosynthesis cysteine-adding enzyme BshC